VAVTAKSNEIPAVRDLLNAFTDLAGAVITIDALHTQSDTAQVITGRGADYVMTVEHASHCSCCLSWRVKQSSLAASDLDTQAFAASPGEVDGVEFAALDLVQHGLAGDAEVAGGLAEGSQPSGAWGWTMSRSCWSMRICQGAPGVSCSPVTKPSRSHR
jgi:hypothetical protein